MMRNKTKILCVLLMMSLLAMPLVGCTKPLTLGIASPTDGRTFDQSQIEVRANVSDAKATVWVNDAEIAVTKYKSGAGYVSTKVDLSEGENTIKVVAARGYKKGQWKDVVERTLTVTYTPK